MTFFKTDELPAAEMLPGVTRRAVCLEGAMMTFFTFAPGAEIPKHDHPHEQITWVVSGALEFTLGDETRVVRAGEGVCCPSGVSHSARVLEEPTVAIDAWHPLREEYR